MAKQFPELEDAHIEFIKQQHIFFVATAGAEGRVNNSPKGMDSFRIINSQKIAWLNLTGSGKESVAHVLENWASKNGEAGIEEYWRKKNTKSLDGKDTGIF